MVDAVDELLPALGSADDVATVAVLLTTVPLATDEATLTTSVKFAVAPAVSSAIELVTVPVPPTAGVTLPQPPGDVNDTNVVPAGSTSRQHDVRCVGTADVL